MEEVRALFVLLRETAAVRELCFHGDEYFLRNIVLAGGASQYGMAQDTWNISLRPNLKAIESLEMWIWFYCYFWGPLHHSNLHYSEMSLLMFIHLFSGSIVISWAMFMVGCQQSGKTLVHYVPLYEGLKLCSLWGKPEIQVTAFKQ